MATRFRLNFEQIFGTSAQVLAGGSLTFCISGGSPSQLQTIYQDDALSVTKLNPVVLDSAGKHGDIFLLPHDYRVIVKDAAGIVLPGGDVDPVHGAPSPVVITDVESLTNYFAPIPVYETDPLADHFDLTGISHLYVSKLETHGGKRSFYVDTNNTDESVLAFRDGLSLSPSRAAIETSPDSNSTLLLVNGWLWNGTETGSYFVLSYTDYTIIKDSWGEPWSTKCFGSQQGTMVIEDFVGVGAANPSGSNWITGFNHIFANRCRFSCDGGNSRNVLTYGFNGQTGGNLNTIQFTNNFFGNATTQTDPTYLLHSLPQNFILRNNTHLSDTGSIKIDNACSGSMSYFLAGRCELDDVYQYTTNGSDSNALRAMEQANRATLLRAENPRMADVAIQSLSPAIWLSDSNTGVTAGTAAYEYLGGATVTQLTATAGDATVRLYASGSGLGLTSYAQYTLVLDFYVTSSCPVSVMVEAYNSKRYAALLQGFSTICLPFTAHPDAGTNLIGVTILSMATATVVRQGRCRIFKGRFQCTSARTVIEDASAAALASVAWAVGDRREHTDPVSGGFIGQVCTTAGTTGTWKNYGAVA
jgi:hypothetical protein